MTVHTSRTQEPGRVVIDHDRCVRCGRCVNLCSGLVLSMVDTGGPVQIDQQRLFGCIGCGQCMAACPQGCIQVEGREISPADLLPLPPQEARTAYEPLHALLLARRSVRRFQARAVEREIVDQIIDASSTAPMGIPPSDVRLFVLDSREKVRQLSDDIAEVAKKSAWLFSPLANEVARPFISKEDYELRKGFIHPMLQFLVEAHGQGENWILYDAPLAMLFYGSPYSDPADPYIAATYAMLAGESLGLGTCMIGAAAPFIRYSDELQRKYGIEMKTAAALFVLFGYPEATYRRALRRTFAKVTFYGGNNAAD
ncbi:4Fe-4S dicluster domain-containing protein [Heliobacterium gestii]|uniref:4Fe-4S dicluster domain-containing protein n=1 Tax=Heliomicrobium gestii TaxID=2699 RepID=A0A845LC56_HELGE|nr:nitroreductase family protein [Heliomicrobium gestii]MBM7866283.1 ferredoxin [Heliomicrobium gestii]MZP42924.1 4Fe-4S dicluster domain-containing protein [Heliomicrobium gestii]